MRHNKGDRGGCQIVSDKKPGPAYSKKKHSGKTSGAQAVACTACFLEPQAVSHNPFNSTRRRKINRVYTVLEVGTVLMPPPAACLLVQ